MTVATRYACPIPAGCSDVFDAVEALWDHLQASHGIEKSDPLPEAPAPEERSAVEEVPPLLPTVLKVRSGGAGGPTLAPLLSLLNCPECRGHAYSRPIDLARHMGKTHGYAEIDLMALSSRMGGVDFFA